MVEKKVMELIENMRKARSMIESACGHIINYQTNVPGYIDSIIVDVNKHLDVILHEARAMFPLCAEARKRYEQIVTIENEMQGKIDAAIESIKAEYEEKIDKLKNGE